MKKPVAPIKETIKFINLVDLHESTTVNSEQISQHNSINLVSLLEKAGTQDLKDLHIAFSDYGYYGPEACHLARKETIVNPNYDHELEQYNKDFIAYEAYREKQKTLKKNFSNQKANLQKQIAKLQKQIKELKEE